MACLKNVKNLGGACYVPFGLKEKIIFTNQYDSTGALNYIPKAQVLNKAYFDGLLAQQDTLKRIYPTPRLANDEGSRPETVFFETSKMQKEESHSPARFEKHRIGISSGEGVVASAMVAKLNSLKKMPSLCGYVISNTGQLLGKETDDGLGIRPLRFDSASVSAQFVFGQTGNPQHIIFGVNWAFDESDENLIAVEPEEFSSYNILSAEGLVDVCYEVVSSSQTNLKIRLYVEGYGTGKNRSLIEGLVVADWVSTVGGATSRLRNTTSSTDITITTAPESPAGEYNLAFASQTIGHLLQPFAVKTKYDFTCCKNKLFAVV